MEQTIRRYRSDWDLTQCDQFENGIYRSRWYLGLRSCMECRIISPPCARNWG